MKNQTGRSMVEMLGVLAIIGLLSVAGIQGYSYAMNKHRANELLNEASKRAVVLAMQITAGRPNLSIDEFNNNTPYGTFSVSPYNGGSTFTLSLTGVDPNVYTQMKASLGDGSTMALSDINNGAFTLTFNKDLSKGVNSDNQTSQNSSEPSENEGGDEENPNPNSCTDTSSCPGAAQCVAGECICSLSSCVQQYYYPDQTSCSCVDCTQTHFTLITDVPQACCEKPVTDGGIGGEWNQQNDNLCHCPGKDEYWSEQQQQCLSPAPCPNPPCEPNPQPTSVCTGYGASETKTGNFTGGSFVVDTTTCYCNTDYKWNGSACTQVTSSTSCTSYTTNECGDGWFCLFSNSTTDPCYETVDPGIGTCTQITGTYAATQSSGGHSYVQQTINWYSASSWCIGNGSTLLPSNSCSWSNVSSETAGLPMGNYWLGLRNGQNNCFGCEVRPHLQMMESAKINGKAAYPLCQ